MALQNLFPVQIENVLTAHPAVREAAAVAVPDAKLGEVVGAWVVREPHAAALSREDVRRAVSQGMNPQVRTSMLGPLPFPFPVPSFPSSFPISRFPFPHVLVTGAGGGPGVAPAASADPAPSPDRD